MPPPWDRASSNLSLLESNTLDRVESDLPRGVTPEPPPWPWIVVLPLIAGFSLALWAGIGMIVRMLGAE